MKITLFKVLSKSQALHEKDVEKRILEKLDVLNDAFRNKISVEASPYYDLDKALKEKGIENIKDVTLIDSTFEPVPIFEFEDKEKKKIIIVSPPTILKNEPILYLKEILSEDVEPSSTFFSEGILGGEAVVELQEFLKHIDLYFFETREIVNQLAIKFEEGEDFIFYDK